MFQPPTSVYYQKQQQQQLQQQQNNNNNDQSFDEDFEDDSSSSHYSASSGLFSFGHQQEYDQPRNPPPTNVMKSVLGVIIPPALADPTAHCQTFPGGIKGSIATELRSAASQDRHFFNQLRVARGRSLLLRTALVKKVKDFESRNGEFNEASFDSVAGTMDAARRERLVKLVPAIRETVAKALEEQPNLVATISGAATEAGARREREDENTTEANNVSSEASLKKQEELKKEVVASASSSSSVAATGGVPSWKARKEAAAAAAAAAAQTSSTSTNSTTPAVPPPPPPPTNALKTSKMFGLFKGALGNALKTQDAAAATVKQRQQIQDRTEKESMLTDIGSMFHDYEKTVPKLDRLTEQSDHAAKVRAESTWLYKMCILEDDAVASAHFLQARIKPSIEEEDGDDDDDGKEENADGAEELSTYQSKTGNNNNNNSASKYPPPIPSDAIFWLPAKHTPNSEQTLRNQLLRAVQRFEAFTDEAKEFLLQQQVKRQVEMTAKITAEDTERGLARHYHLNRKQNEEEGGLFALPDAEDKNSKKKKDGNEEDDEEEDSDEDFENAEEDDPTMMM